MGVEALYFFKFLHIGEEQLRLVGQLAELEGATIHERLDEPREETSHQFPGEFSVEMPAKRLNPALIILKSGPHSPQKSGAHGCRFEGLQEGAKAFLLFIFEREEREPRHAATIAALVHDVFHACDAALRDDELRGAQNHFLQFARPLVLTLADQFIKLNAL